MEEEDDDEEEEKEEDEDEDEEEEGVKKGDGKVTRVFSREGEREHLSPTGKRRNAFRNQNTGWPCLDEHFD